MNIAFFTENRFTGILFVIAFLLFAIGATLPLMGDKGNPNIYTIPARDTLLAIAKNPGAWQWANIFMGSAVVALAAGMVTFTTGLEQAGERTFSRLGLLGIVFTAVVWLIFSAYRASLMVVAAQETASTGTVPTYYEPVSQWGGALFYVYAVLGFLSLAVYAISALNVNIVPGWACWVTIIFSLALIVQLVVTGDTLPVFHFVPPLLIGILLLITG